MHSLALAHLCGEKYFFSRTWKAQKCCLWQMKRGAFEAALRLADADSAREPDGATVSVEKINGILFRRKRRMRGFGLHIKKDRFLKESVLFYVFY